MTGGLQQWHADFFTVQDREMQATAARAPLLASCKTLAKNPSCLCFDDHSLAYAAGALAPAQEKTNTLQKL